MPFSPLLPGASLPMTLRLAERWRCVLRAAGDLTAQQAQTMSQTKEPPRREASTQITVPSFGLRGALLDLLAEEAREMADVAAPPLLAGKRNTTLARTYWMRMSAVARLLDDIGWFAAKPTSTYEIDVAEHAWAAQRALEVFIANQDALVRSETAMNDPEAAGDAMGRREDARRTLGLLEGACAGAGITVDAPRP